MPYRRKPSRQQSDVLLEHGVRSGLEESECARLTGLGVRYRYESFKISYAPSPKLKKYTPDILLPNGIIVELKGRFVTADRGKHLLVQAQHPALDIRFVFSNMRQRISKQSKTTYEAWCAHKGFKCANKIIPQAWIDEPLNLASLHAAESM